MSSNGMARPAHRGRSWRVVGWGGAVALFLLPLVAMQFTREMRWDAGDFAQFAVMLVVAGLAIEAAVRLTRAGAVRLGIIAMVALVFLLVWADGAVGIFA